MTGFGAEMMPLTYATGALLFCLGLLLGRVGVKRLRTEVTRARNASVEAELVRKQISKQHAGILASSKTLSLFVGKLTDGVGRLNRASLDERDVNIMIADLARAVFDPDQILLYRTGVDLRQDLSADQDLDDDILTLVEHDGLSTVPPEVVSIPVGEGKIGWVAAHRVEMTRKDWQDPARTEGVCPLPNHNTLKLDLISPIIRHAGDKTKTLGVLCIGRPKARQDRNAKLMLQTISNLGSIAYSHAISLSEMKARANFDGLTGLMIKGHFRRELGNLIHTLDETVGNMGIFIFDIDHFKTYNDTNGHPEGDSLLREFAGVIRANLRPGDMACRYGGEEFVVAMPGVDAEAALQAAERIRAAVEAHKFRLEQSQPQGTLTISGGVAAYPKEGTDGDELIRHADEALYEAKRTGRNKVLRFRAVEIGNPEGDPVDEYGPHFTERDIDAIWDGGEKA